MMKTPKVLILRTKTVMVRYFTSTIGFFSMPFF